MTVPRYNFVDMTGVVVGKLTVLSQAPTVNGTTRWLCRCECGAQEIIDGIRFRHLARTSDQRTVAVACVACVKRARFGAKRSEPERRQAKREAQARYVADCRMGERGAIGSRATRLAARLRVLLRAAEGPGTNPAFVDGVKAAVGIVEQMLDVRVQE